MRDLLCYICTCDWADFTIKSPQLLVIDGSCLGTFLMPAAIFWNKMHYGSFHLREKYLIGYNADMASRVTNHDSLSPGPSVVHRLCCEISPTSYMYCEPKTPTPSRIANCETSNVSITTVLLEPVTCTIISFPCMYMMSISARTLHKSTLIISNLHTALLHSYSTFPSITFTELPLISNLSTPSRASFSVTKIPISLCLPISTP